MFITPTGIVDCAKEEESLVVGLGQQSLGLAGKDA